MYRHNKYTCKLIKLLVSPSDDFSRDFLRVGASPSSEIEWMISNGWITSSSYSEYSLASVCERERERERGQGKMEDRQDK